MGYKNNPLLNEPSTTTNDQGWIQWHKDCKATFGKKTANSLFSAFWAKRGATNSKANTNALRSYAESQGFQIQGDSISGIVDSIYDIGDAFGDVFKIGKYATIGVGVMLLGGVAMLIWSITKEPFKAIAAASAGATGGFKGGM
jgi:hypothetical protein